MNKVSRDFVSIEKKKSKNYIQNDLYMQVNYFSIAINTAHLFFRAVLTLLSLFLMHSSFCQNSKEDVLGWEKISIVYKKEEVKGMSKVAEVHGTSEKALAKPLTLKKKALVQVKKLAARQGASVVLITVDTFEKGLLNKAILEGIAYRVGDVKERDHLSKSTEVKSMLYQKVIITRRSEEVSGLKPVAQVKVTSKGFLRKVSKLKTMAFEKLRQEAAAKGASTVYITEERLDKKVMNQITVEGIAYK